MLCGSLRRRVGRSAADRASLFAGTNERAATAAHARSSRRGWLVCSTLRHNSYAPARRPGGRRQARARRRNSRPVARPLPAKIKPRRRGARLLFTGVKSFKRDSTVKYRAIQSRGLLLSSWATRNHRQFDDAQFLDIESRIYIGIGRVMTDLADKLRLRLTVALFAVTAGGARSAGIARVNVEDANACDSRLVFHENSELSKSPVRVPGTLRFPNLCSLANMRQIFNRYRSRCVFGFLNKPFTDYMIYICLIAALASAHHLKFAFSRTSTSLLQRGASVGIPLTLCFYLLATIALTLAISSYFDDTKVHAKHIINIARRRRWNFTHRQKIELSLAINEVGFSDARFKQLPLALAACVRNLPTTFNRPDTHELLISFP